MDLVPVSGVMLPVVDSPSGRLRFFCSRKKNEDVLHPGVNPFFWKTMTDSEPHL